MKSFWVWRWYFTGVLSIQFRACVLNFIFHFLKIPAQSWERFFGDLVDELRFMLSTQRCLNTWCRAGANYFIFSGHHLPDVLGCCSCSLDNRYLFSRLIKTMKDSALLRLTMIIMKESEETENPMPGNIFLCTSGIKDSVSQRAARRVEKQNLQCHECIKSFTAWPIRGL